MKIHEEYQDVQGPRYKSQEELVILSSDYICFLSVGKD